jgi:uncharacterized protein (TIGR02145 family)
MKRTIFLFAALAFFGCYSIAQTVTDYDGNVYHAVTIGSQVWLQENLKVTHYRNGDSIPNVTDNTQWGNLNTGAYCNYRNDTNYVKTYGYLYNWFAVADSRKICPVGWHVPHDSVWTDMYDYLGHDGNPGGKLKEIGTSHWKSPNLNATNETGFTALPGSMRAEDGTSYPIGYYAYFWCSNEYLSSYAKGMVLSYYKSVIDITGPTKKSGCSIRCLMDSTTNINEINDDIEIEIYPNPASGKIYINYKNIRTFKLLVYNMIGENVLQKELNNRTKELDISCLRKGIYILKFTSLNGTFTKKLIIK